MTLLTIQDAADRLQMSTGFVKLAIRKGELRAMKFGRCTRISEQDFEEYCAGKIEGSTQSREGALKEEGIIIHNGESIRYRL